MRVKVWFYRCGSESPQRSNVCGGLHKRSFVAPSVLVSRSCAAMCHFHHPRDKHRHCRPSSKFQIGPSSVWVMNGMVSSCILDMCSMIIVASREGAELINITEGIACFIQCANRVTGTLFPSRTDQQAFS